MFYKGIQNEVAGMACLDSHIRFLGFVDHGQQRQFFGS
jgi:hypothetical protein